MLPLAPGRIDDDRLAELRAEMQRQHPGHRIHGTAGRLRQNQLDDPIRIPLIRSERIARRACEYQKTGDRHRAKGSSDGLEVDHAFLFLSFCLVLPLAKHGIGDSDGLNAGRNSAIRMVWARRKPPVCRALRPFCAPGSSYPRRLAPTGEGYVKQSRTTQEIKCGVEMRSGRRPLRQSCALS